jgi:hypothetical protein
MLILGVIGLVPDVGASVFLVGIIFGFGAELVSRFGRVEPVVPVTSGQANAEG